MSQCEVDQCNSTAGKRVRHRGVELWLCSVHATGLNDGLHLKQREPARGRVPPALVVPPCPQPLRSKRNRDASTKPKRGHR